MAEQKKQIETDRMFELAFRYKKARPWELMSDTEIFAVRLSDGETGYCCVMGRGGEEYSLALYVGDKGLASYLEVAAMDAEDMRDPVTLSRLVSRQVCLQCFFENKGNAQPEQIEAAQHYARSHGLTLRGKYAFPVFMKYEEGRLAWRFGSKLDADRICDALEAASILGDTIRKKGKRTIGLGIFWENDFEIPLMEKKNGEWTFSLMEMPDIEDEYEEPVFSDELLAAKIRKRKKRGIWECEIVRAPTPTILEGHEEEAPYFPLLLTTLDQQSGLIMQPILSGTGNVAELMEGFAQLLQRETVIPKTVICSEEMTYFTLLDLCEKAGLSLELEEIRSEDMDDFLHDMFDGVSEPPSEEKMNEEMEQIFFDIMQMSDKEIRELIPMDFRMWLLDLAKDGAMPEDLAKRLLNLFKRK